MTIHHATKAKAEKENIKLVDNSTDTTQTYTATSRKGNIETNANDAKTALNLALIGRALKAEYPNVAVISKETDGTWEHHIVAGVVTGENQEIDLPKTASDLTLSDVVEACRDADIDPEEGTKEARQVIPSHYKRIYAERGNPNHNGDWLAQELEDTFLDAEGLFDWQTFKDFLIRNDVDMSGKWAQLPESGQKGWKGRYRCNGRQKLELKVAETGKITLLNDTVVKAPEEFMADMATKHPNIEYKG